MSEPLLPWIVGPLADALRNARGHALLVHGPTGIGQFEAGYELARSMLCEAGADERPQGLACGACASCKLVASHTHPDLRVLLPEAVALAFGWFGDAEESAAEEGGAKKRAPSKEIRVEQVRATLDFSALTRARGRLKVVLIYPAERLNHVAANALLKTLEEPSEDQRFILASQAPERLMPTIRSRCQALRLPLQARSQALEWLASQGVAEPEVLLDATGGSPLRALEWQRSGVEARVWQALPAAVRQGQAQAFADWPVPRVIDALLRLCHDALRVQQGASPLFFRALVPAGQGAGQGVGLVAWSLELLRQARHAEHPVNAGLLIESLVTQGQQALR